MQCPRALQKNPGGWWERAASLCVGVQDSGVLKSQFSGMRWAVVKPPPANVRDMGSIPGWGRSPGGGNDDPLQSSCWKIPWTEGPGGLLSMELQRVRHSLGGKRTCMPPLETRTDSPWATRKARGIPGTCHHSQSTPGVSVHSPENCFSLQFLEFQAEDRLTPQWHLR